MGAAVVQAALGALAVLLILIVVIAMSQVIARRRWLRAARPRNRRAPRWSGHMESRQVQALWDAGPPSWLGWFWRGLYPITLRARPDGLLLTPRGLVFGWACGHPSAVIAWSDLVRVQERRLGRASIELGPTVVPLTRVSLGVTGRTATRLMQRPNPSPTYLRFVTPSPEGLVDLIAASSSQQTHGPEDHQGLR